MWTLQDPLIEKRRNRMTQHTRTCFSTDNARHGSNAAIKHLKI